MTEPAAGQGATDAYFDDVAAFWRDVYEAPTLGGTIYRRRRQRVLAWVDELALPPAAAVLEVGAGAGPLTAELARRGLRVTALDSSEAMVALLGERVRESGLEGQVTVEQGDAHALDLPSGSFHLVVAIGVVPWLHAPVTALREMARVARPGGALILTSDNRSRLNHLLDPRWHPRVLPALRALRRRLAARGLVTAGRPNPLLSMYRRGELLALLAEAGVRPERLASVGFGPFTLAGQRILGESAGIWLDERLQRLADRGVPGLRHAGSHHLVLARDEAR